MALKKLVRPGFIGGRLIPAGETIDVDEKGETAPAGSTPVAMLSIEQIESVLAQKKREAAREGGAEEDPSKEDGQDSSSDRKDGDNHPLRPSRGRPRKPVDVVASTADGTENLADD